MLFSRILIGSCCGHVTGSSVSTHKSVNIGRKNIERTYRLASVEGILDLAEVNNKCDLGVIFTSNLQFDKHITNICAKANRIVGISNIHVFA